MEILVLHVTAVQKIKNSFSRIYHNKLLNMSKLLTINYYSTLFKPCDVILPQKMT